MRSDVETALPARRLYHCANLRGEYHSLRAVSRCYAAPNFVSEVYHQRHMALGFRWSVIFSRHHHRDPLTIGGDIKIGIQTGGSDSLFGPHAWLVGHELIALHR